MRSQDGLKPSVSIGPFLPVYYKLKAASLENHLWGVWPISGHLPHLPLHLLPGELNVRLDCEPRADGEPQDVSLPDLARRDMDPPRLVDLRVELLVDRVRAFQPEADKSHRCWHRQFKPFVSFHQLGKFLSKHHLWENMNLLQNNSITCSRMCACRPSTP